MGNPLHKVNRWIFYIVLMLIIVYDIIAAVMQDWPTISKTALFEAHRHPALPFACGWLMGHLYVPWPRKVYWLLLGAIGGGLGMIGLDYFMTLTGHFNPVWEFLKQWPIVSLLIGIPFGALFTQKKDYPEPEEE